MTVHSVGSVRLTEQEKPFSKEEMLERFDVLQYRHKVTRYERVFRLSDTNFGEQFSGILRWDADDGYSIMWDGAAPENWERPEFEYLLDSILEEEHA